MYFMRAFSTCFVLKVSCKRCHFCARRFNRNLLCNSRNVNFECVSFLSPGLLCDIKILDMLLFPDPGAKRIYEIFAVTYWNVQIFGKTHTRHDAHKHCPFPYLAVRRGVRSDAQLRSTETRFQKCSQSGKNGSKHPMLSISMAFNVISCKKVEKNTQKLKIADFTM